MPRPAITFETKIWERDWKLILRTGRIKRMIDACRYEFAERILYINNVNDGDAAAREAAKLLKDKTLTSIMFVEALADKALEAFNVTKESFGEGYYYSVQELAGIYNCRTEYLLHFSGDSIITNKESWIAEAIETMEKDKTAFVANPWDGRPAAPGLETISEDENFRYSTGFSDQCYLIRAADFKKPIYNETNPAASVYPVYAGELFEKRVFSYMKNHGLFRLTSKKAVYKHQNFPRDPIRRALVYLFGLNLKKGR